MRIITPKQRKINESWSKITQDKIRELNGVCQFCERVNSDIPFDFLSGHHIVKRRYGIHTRENHYLMHYWSCHLFVEEHNIDVRIYPTRSAWEAEVGH